MSNSFGLPGELIDMAHDVFVEEFGREPGPHDPLIWGKDEEGQPRHLVEDEVDDLILGCIAPDVMAGVHPQTALQNLMPHDRQQECRARIASKYPNLFPPL